MARRRHQHPPDNCLQHLLALWGGLRTVRPSTCCAGCSCKDLAIPCLVRSLRLHQGPPRPAEDWRRGRSLEKRKQMPAVERLVTEMASEKRKEKTQMDGRTLSILSRITRSGCIYITLQNGPCWESARYSSP